MKKMYEVRRTIAAEPAAIWRIISDAKALQDGDFGIEKIEGTIAPGEKIKLWADINPGRAFALKVTEFQPNKRMVWSGGMPLGLFTGTRQFNLSPAGGGTDFHMREEFTGLMSGLIVKSIPDLQPTFDQFAATLQQMTEGGVS